MLRMLIESSMGSSRRHHATPARVLHLAASVMSTRRRYPAQPLLFSCAILLAAGLGGARAAAPPAPPRQIEDIPAAEFEASVSVGLVLVPVVVRSPAAT